MSGSGRGSELRGPTRRAVSVAASGKVLRTFVRTPQLLATTTLQGVLFLLVFRFVFGGAIDVGPLDYTAYMVPGILVAGILFTAAGAAVGVAEEASTGFLDRLRALPLPPGAALAGRVMGETAVVVWALVVMATVGYAVGFRPDGSLLGMAAAFALLAAFAYAVVWLFTALGLLAGHPQAAGGFAFAAVPLSFVSSVYVPVESMPGWLQWFARNQPVTDLVDAVRGLVVAGAPTGAASTAASVGRSLVWIALCVAVGALAAWRRYERA